MFQVDKYVERSALSTPGMNPPSDASLRDKITATIIREEAAESLLPSILNDAELVALNSVLNRYQESWWVQHLSLVGADPARYWREQLGDEIKAASKGKTNTSQRKKFAWWVFRSSAASITYELSQLDLSPL
jgi:hypothetical protein